MSAGNSAQNERAPFGPLAAVAYSDIAPGVALEAIAPFDGVGQNGFTKSH